MLEGKVAIVTGSGRGIGKEVALLFAKLGAKVVVNDPGVSVDGKGGDSRVSDEVVGLIKQSGGEAVANYDSVASFEGAKNIVESAVSNYGKVDILINNAGILRDCILHKMSEEEWDAVISVHLKGTFNTCRHVLPLMRQQRWGRIINFVSTSGLIGNIGQANYAAAKMGIVGLTRVVALEGEKWGITANSVAPFAWTRMTGTIPTDDERNKARVEKLQKLEPSYIAPLVAFLASDEAAIISGQIFGVRAKEVMLFSQCRPIRSIYNSAGWSAGDLGKMILASMKHSFCPLESSGELFAYPPLV